MATIDELYRELEGKFQVNERSDYGDLVRPNGNAAKPFHRWFHMKEGFSHRLLSAVITSADLNTSDKLVVVDPFVGSGTTVVSAGLALRDGETRVTAVGIERNPFLAFLGRTTALAMSRGAGDLRDLARRATSNVKAGRVRLPEIPRLSTFSVKEYFPNSHLEKLLMLREAVEGDEGATRFGKDLALIALAGAVEPASALRKDGRALRYEEKKVSVDPLDEFELRVKRMLEDMRDFGALEQACLSILEGDGRSLSSVIPELVGEASLVLFSPPYLNNIDYTEVYKLEAWLLGFFETQDEFREARRRTIRSHPSVKFPSIGVATNLGLEEELEGILEPLKDSVPENDHRNWRRALIDGYFRDMLISLQQAKSIVATDGRVVFVVGNSLHGNSKGTYLVAADLLLARIAELVGLEVERIEVARRPRRRAAGSDLLRESIVHLKDRWA